MNTLTDAMAVAIADLLPDPDNARKQPPPKAAIDRLVASMEEIGQLQPIVVRQHPTDFGSYFLVAGRCRVAAATALGWENIAAVEINGAVAPLAASAAENMVRQDMHPVDQWRSIAKLVEGGLTLERAIAALGIERHPARRMILLAKMDPEIIECLSADDALPSETYLRKIANAPLERQHAALVAHRKRPIDWYTLANACDIARIPRSSALFDPADYPDISWNEDLFAQPGDETAITTRDVDAFLAAQQAYIEAEMRARPDRYQIGEVDQYGDLVAPKGWRLDRHVPIPKRWKKDDPRRVISCVTGKGYNAGLVSRCLIVPRKAEEPRIFDEPAPRERPEITKAVQTQLAKTKGSILRSALPAFVRDASIEDSLRALITVFAFDNLEVRIGRQTYSRTNFPGIAARMLNDDGSYKPMERQDLAALVAAIIDQSVRFDSPEEFGSGDAAEWLGTLLGADEYRERFDTADILRGFNGPKLREIAADHGINAPANLTVAALRKRMVGNMPGWRPFGFGALPPAIEPDEPDDIETEETSEEDTP